MIIEPLLQTPEGPLMEGTERDPTVDDGSCRGSAGSELVALRLSVEQLADAFSKEQERAEFRESIIDRLHGENQQLRRDQIATALQPVQAGLYRLHDTLRRQAALWADPDPPGNEHVAVLLDALADDATQVLARTGAEPFTPEIGRPFDREWHRSRRAVDIDEPSAVETVVEVLACGFTQGEKVLRKADVVVGRAAVQPNEQESVEDQR